MNATDVLVKKIGNLVSLSDGEIEYLAGERAIFICSEKWSQVHFFGTGHRRKPPGRSPAGRMSTEVRNLRRARAFHDKWSVHRSPESVLRPGE